MQPRTRTAFSHRRRPAAALLVLFLVCASLVSCSGRSNQAGLDIPGFDPNAAGNGDQASTRAALNYLSPDGEINDGRWVPGEQTKRRWEALTDRRWGPTALEELTAAMAAASTIRISQDDDASAAATWTTARSIVLATDQIPAKDCTDTVKQNLAALLSNSPDEIAALAGGGTLEGDSAYGLSGFVTDSQFETVLYRVIDNKTTAGTLTSAMLQYHHNQVDSEMPTATDPETTLLAQYKDAAKTMGYLDGITELHTDNDSDDTIDTSDIITVLSAQGYVQAAQYGLLNDTTIEAAATGNNGGPFSFYTDVDGQPAITAPDPMTPEAAHEYINWRTLVNDFVMIDMDTEISQGYNIGYNEGQAAEITN